MYHPPVVRVFTALLLLAACAPRADVAYRREALRSAGPHRLTNPLLDFETNVEFREIASFRGKLEGLAARATASGDATHVSIYFRDLNNGPWFGVNQNELFTPASLFKVPFMMGLLKQAESDPALLSKRLKVDLPSDPYQATLPAPVMVVRGEVYTVEQLLELVVAHSDNVALFALDSLQAREVYDRVFTELGLAAPAPNAVHAEMRVKDYAAFFRILYNASYLNREMSEKALGFLSRSSFTKGLPAGIPPGTPVAHKFGDRELSSGQLQLHDCGIVYHPRTPYVLCVMTRGKSLEGLLKTIVAASGLVWNEVDALRPR